MALDGFEGSAAAVTAPTPRMPFLGRAKPDARAVAEAVFKAEGGTCLGGKTRGDQVGSVVSRNGRSVPVAIRRAQAAGQMELLL